MSDKLVLTRTIKALEEYDAADAEYEKLMSRHMMVSGRDADATLKRLDRLAEAVGYAYGLDTSDRNSVETCRQCVRPGPKIPAPGCELSFVRRMVADASHLPR